MTPGPPTTYRPKQTGWGWARASSGLQLHRQSLEKGAPVTGGQLLGELLWDWGVPTAASVVNVTHCGLNAIATGGMRTGLDAARALALGATAAGFARNVFIALTEGGRDGAVAFLQRVENQLRSVMLLCGAGNVAELRRAPRMIGPNLQQWMTLAGA